MTPKVYVRDNRSPKPKSEIVSRVMSANKARNTKPEVLLQKELRKRGGKNFKLNLKKIPGRPDICFVGPKLAVFVNGCFWHRCPYCKLKTPKTNSVFWLEKFTANKRRDRKKRKVLKRLGWKVMTIWECKLKNDPEKYASKILSMIK